MVANNVSNPSEKDLSFQELIELQDLKILGDLLLDIQGKPVAAQPGGAPIERIITLRNRGAKAAEIELWLAPTDLRSEPIQAWSRLSYSAPELILQPQAKIDITLLIIVPPEAEAGFYSYEVCARSPQYEHAEVHKPQQLQVLGNELAIQLSNEPQFTLAPDTHPETPYNLGIGEVLTLTAHVENRSHRTDRYFLTLLDVPTSWFSVEYPESNIELPGFITRTDGLQLNPGESGDITLTLHPPTGTPAGQHFPTVQLSGSNRDEVVLLEVVYLTIPIDDRLGLSLSPETHRIPPKRATFDLTVVNLGNVHRHLSINAQDEHNAFSFIITPQELELPLSQRATIIIEAKPKSWLSRLCHRTEQTVPFQVTLENIADILLEDTHELTPFILPKLPKAMPTATLDWQPYRRWLFWLVIALGITGALSLIAWLAWYSLIWRPNLRPKIILLDTTSNTYQEGASKRLALNWDITNPQKVKSLSLSWEENTAANVYPLNLSEEALPTELASHCRLTETVDQAQSFIAPLLRFHRRRQTGSENLQVLQCRDFPPVGFSQTEGSYTFALKGFNKPEARGLRTVETTNPIAVSPAAPPAIVSFSSEAIAYRRKDNGTLEAIQSISETPPPAGTPAPLTIPINWEISNANKIQSLRFGSLAEDGTQNVKEQTFDLSNGLPYTLGSYCQIANNRLRCDQLPTDANTVAYYNFYLQVIPKPSQTQPALAPKENIFQTAPTVAIAPFLPEILSFRHNGQDVLDEPKRIIQLEAGQPPTEVILSWDVVNADTVELLPAPGRINVNSIAYPVSPNAGTESVTLRAVNAAGEEVTRSLVIEKVVRSPAPPPPPETTDNP
ncbi:MAG: hypothetical protein AAFP03_04055 [Cyanobacteria bacterium J06598_3]